MNRRLMSRPLVGRGTRPRALSTQSGVGILELLLVLMLVAVMLAVSVPAFHGFYQRHQLRKATGDIRSMVRYARIKTLKEKISHRILFHDESAATPNRFEVQKNQGGSFVTLPRYAQSLPEGMRILGSGPTDSMDILSVGRRGACSAGQVFVQAKDGVTLGVISIEPTCHTNVL